MSEYKRIFVTGIQLDEALAAELGSAVLKADLDYVMSLPMGAIYRMEFKRWGDMKSVSCEIMEQVNGAHDDVIVGSWSGTNMVAVIGNAWLEYRHSIKGESK